MIDGTVLPLPQKLSTPGDSELVRREQYRHEVRYCLESNDGKFGPISNIYLDVLRDHFKLTSTETEEIKVSALYAYQRYENAVEGLINSQNSLQNNLEQTGLIPTLDRKAVNHLRRLHHNLSLPRWKAIKIEHQVLSKYMIQRNISGCKPAQQKDGAGM